LIETSDDLALGIDSWAEGLLRWFFAEGETAGAPPSNFGSMIAAISIGCSDRPHAASSALGWTTIHVGSTRARQPVQVDERALAAHARARPARRALSLLTDGEQAILRAVFGPHGGSLPGLGWAAPAAEWTASGRLAHLRSHSTHPFHAWLVRTCARARKSGGAERETIAEIRAEAEALVRTAVRTFATAARREAARA